MNRRQTGLADATKDPLAMTPPFALSRVHTRLFPLRASLDALQKLCNGYLNIVPPEVGRFRAVVPYVYLMALDYGKLSGLVSNLGWFAQHEFFFCTPVEWYKVIDGKWVFHDWAVLTPFIYVDDNISAPLGREVFGWPKIVARVVPATSPWLRDPVAAESVLRVETSVFPELYQGLPLRSRVFLEIDRDASVLGYSAPPDAQRMAAPWNIAANVATAMAGFGRDAMGLAQAMRIAFPNPGADPAFMAQMLERMTPAFAPGGLGLVTNCLNVKQFRLPEDPTQACYQALTNGPFQFDQLYGGGVLGEERIALGDMTGGYSIKLHAFPSVCIAETLGLDVSERHKGNEGVEVLTVKPVMPFWYDADMTYLVGRNLAWRSADGIWRDNAGDPMSSIGYANSLTGPTVFNSTVGSAVDEIAGPFRFVGTTMRVLPLIAERAKLTQFLDSYLNVALTDEWGVQRRRLSVWARPAVTVEPNVYDEAHAAEFELGGDHASVYMTVSTFEAVQSVTNDVGDWINAEVAFMIPVKWEYLGDDGEWTLEGVGVVPAFSFVEQIVAAISRVEVVGIPTIRANFSRPQDAWMRPDAADLRSDQQLLTVSAEVMPALDEGQKAVTSPLVEISRLEYEADGVRIEAEAPGGWSEMLRRELTSMKTTRAQYPSECKISRALALEILGNEAPVSLYTLKQFRDVIDPNKACYQSLVRVKRTFADIVDLREIEETILVHIHDYASLSIVESLGIVAKPVYEGANHSGILYSTQAVRPFYLRATVSDPLGERLVERAGTLPVQFYDKAKDDLLNDSGPAITVDGLAETLQDQGNPCRMDHVMRLASQRRQIWPSDIRKDAARTALERVGPEMIVDAILSREWGNRSENARWRRGVQQLESSYELILAASRTSLFGAAEAALFADVEAALFADIEYLLRAGGGRAPAVSGAASALFTPEHSLPNLWRPVNEMIENMKRFTRQRYLMEENYGFLSALVIALSPAAQQGEFAFTVPVPPAEQVSSAVNTLLDVLDEITTLRVIGDPSPASGLDNDVRGDYYRLKQLVETLARDLRGKADLAALVSMNSTYYTNRFGDAVRLARRYCDVQHRALVNKMSRAFQKPDFCIQRQSVGSNCDRLLPVSLSWNDQWYYGRVVHSTALDAFPNVVPMKPG
jgi:hypothetical protein